MNIIHSAMLSFLLKLRYLNKALCIEKSFMKWIEISLFFYFCLIIFHCQSKPSVQDVAIWHIFETSFTSSRTYENPVQDITVRVSFRSPNSEISDVEAFWDGGKIWRVRFQPEVEGIWTYTATCSDEENTGLHGQEGKFICKTSNDKRALYRHGRIRVSDDEYTLVHADGTPFFWLACTAWNGALLSNDKDWDKYLTNRKLKGFTAIQFVTTQWRGGKSDIEERTAFIGREQILINPKFFQRLDKKVDAINEHDLLAVPVMLWALNDKNGLSPGYFLSEEQAIVLARYILARYGAHHVLWFLGGDGHFEKEYSIRWKKIGRGVFGEELNTGKRGLAALHPSGRNWILDYYDDELWYNVIGYQSGHSAAPNYSQWICQGPPSKGWRGKRPRPVINLEPCYEGHMDYNREKRIDDYEVRRASYWSMLIAPTAGVTYGANGIWPWQFEEGVPLNHSKNNPAPPWWESLDLPGSLQVGFLKKAFELVEWWRLRPAQEILIDQPGYNDIQKFIAVSAAENRDCAFVYVPVAIDFSLDLSDFPSYLTGLWFDPRIGSAPISFPVKGKIKQTFTPPEEGDWVMILKEP